MTSIGIAVIAFACAFGGALVGVLLRSALPGHHLSEQSKDVVKLGMGLIATMTALVLGLVTASAKTSFDAVDTAVKNGAVSILTLDRLLARYGPETKQVRDLLRRVLIYKLDTTWPAEGSQRAEVDTSETTPAVEGIEDQILHLSPKTDTQRWLRSRALAMSDDLLKMRWSVLAGAGHSVQLPFLVVVVFWLTVIFGSFGLFAPRNATVIAVLFVCAVSVAASIFLILDMHTPFEGLMKISSAPLRYTLSHLGQ